MANVQETFTREEIMRVVNSSNASSYRRFFEKDLDAFVLKRQVVKDLAEAKTVQERQLIIIKNPTMEFLMWGTEYMTLKAFVEMIAPISHEVNIQTIFEEYSGFKVPNFRGRVKQSKKVAITNMLAAKKELSAK